MFIDTFLFFTLLMLPVGVHEGNLKVKIINGDIVVYIIYATCFSHLMLGFESIEQVKEVHHFIQDDLTTEDVYILDCHSNIFVWVGQQVDVKVRLQALDIGEVIFCFCHMLFISCIISFPLFTPF